MDFPRYFGRGDFPALMYRFELVLLSYLRVERGWQGIKGARGCSKLRGLFVREMFARTRSPSGGLRSGRHAVSLSADKVYICLSIAQ